MRPVCIKRLLGETWRRYVPKLGSRDAVPHKSPPIKVVPEVCSGAVARSFWDSMRIFFHEIEGRGVGVELRVRVEEIRARGSRQSSRPSVSEIVHTTQETISRGVLGSTRLAPSP